jgi:hypothetical protein
MQNHEEDIFSLPLYFRKYSRNISNIQKKSCSATAMQA